MVYELSAIKLCITYDGLGSKFGTKHTLFVFRIPGCMCQNNIFKTNFRPSSSPNICAKVSHKKKQWYKFHHQSRQNKFLIKTSRHLRKMLNIYRNRYLNVLRRRRMKIAWRNGIYRTGGLTDGEKIIQQKNASCDSKFY